jgi:uncharacterized protein
LSVYLDASALVSLFANDVLSLRADAILRARRSALIVSDFAAAEFAAAIARRMRTRFLTMAEARIAFSNFDAWTARETEQVQITAADVVSAASFIRRLDLTLRAPDAIHIAIAQRVGAELFTFDERMMTAARALGTNVVAG